MIPRMGILRSIKLIFLAFLFFNVTFFLLLPTSVSSAGISVWPPEISVKMSDVFPEEPIKFNIQVNNLYSKDINASARVEDQITYRLKKGYTNIPNLSWIKVSSDIFNISAKKSKVLEVSIDVPDDEKLKHDNELWEVCVIISEIKDEFSTISTEYAITIFIKTPVKEKMENFELFFLIFIIFIGIALAAYIFYFRDKKKVSINKKTNFFYFKKKKNEK